jgi:hypothetical protein
MDCTLLKTRERCLKAENQRLTKKLVSSKASSSEALSEDEAPKNEYLARIMGSDYPSILSELKDDKLDHIIGSLSRHRKKIVSSISNASPVLIMVKCELIFMIV